MTQGLVRRWWKSPGIRRARRRLSDLQVLFYPLAGLLMWAWWRIGCKTVRYERRGPLFEYIREGKPCIVALWHQDVFPLVFELARYTAAYPTLFLVSPGRIGRIGTYFLGMWHIECVAGSSAARGIEAIDELARRARDESKSVFLMADGSRGPARQAKWGAVYLARDTGLPIIAARGWGNRLLLLKRTWMQLALPLPWGKAIVLSSDPLFVPREADKTTLDRYRLELQNRLNVLCDQAAAVFPDSAAQAEALS